MQKCYNCGKEVSDETLICPECGALVKRYTTPPARQAEQEAQNNEMWDGYAQNFSNAQPQRPDGSVWRDGNAKVHFRGGLTAWLVVCLLVTGYMLLSYLSVQFLYRNQDLYFSVLESMPELSGYAEILRPLMEYIQSYNAYFIVQTVLSAALFASVIWLLAGKSKAALFASLGIDVLFALLLAFMNPVAAILFAGGAAVTFFWMKKYLPLLR